MKQLFILLAVPLMLFGAMFIMAGFSIENPILSWSGGTMLVLSLFAAHKADKSK